MTVTWTINGTTVDGVEADRRDRRRGETESLGLRFFDSGNGSITDRRDTIQEYLEYADRVQHDIDANRRPTFYELTPDDDPVRNHVWKIEPGSSVSDGSYWGLVVGGEDSTVEPSGVKRLDVDVVFLADLHRYADREAVVEDLGLIDGCFMFADASEALSTSSPETVERCAVIRGSYTIQA